MDILFYIFIGILGLCFSPFILFGVLLIAYIAAYILIFIFSVLALIVVGFCKKFKKLIKHGNIDR